jgi:hypothetical protein
MITKGSVSILTEPFRFSIIRDVNSAAKIDQNKWNKEKEPNKLILEMNLVIVCMANCSTYT